MSFVMRDDVLAALAFGRVLPLSADRKPCVPFLDAADCAAKAYMLFARFPGAGIGVLTDHRYVVLDVESVAKHGEDGFATLDRLLIEVGPLPPTREHATKSGGAHLIFIAPPGVAIRSAQGELRGAGLPAKGIDVVAGNAVMRWPGTPGYTLHADRPVQMLPDAWCGALVDPPVEHQAVPRIDAPHRSRLYAVTVLERCALELASASALRNPLLAKIAFRVGRFCPPLTEIEIEGDLMLACEGNGMLKEHGARACLGTIRRCMRAGMAKPLRLVG